MDGLTFTSKLIDAVAWPAAAVTILFLVRDEIKPLLRILKRVKAGPLEAEFDRVVKELEQTKEIARSAEEKAEIVATKLDEAEPVMTPPPGKLTDHERLILESIANSKYAMRSITGIAESTGLAKATVSSVLNDLIRKGFVKQTKNDARQLRWYPSNAGRSAASES